MKHDRRLSIIERVMERVIFSTELFEGTPCHIWTGPTSGENGRGAGYPRMCLDGQTVAVHKVTFTHHYGFIPGRKQVDHRCRRRLCVNPLHLELVTHKQNCKRRDRAIQETKNERSPPRELLFGHRC